MKKAEFLITMLAIKGFGSILVSSCVLIRLIVKKYIDVGQTKLTVNNMYNHVLYQMSSKCVEIDPD